MPPRHITLVIAAFWVAMSGWLFYRDLWPSLRPGAPPPYVIDLVDEARFRESNNHWFVFQNGREVGYANTWVDFRGSDDTFRMNGEFKIRRPQGVAGDPLLEMKSMYRVTRSGELREVSAEVTIRVVPFLQFFVGSSVSRLLAPVFKNVDAEIKGSVSGPVRDGKLALRYKVPQFQIEDELPPIDVANRGSVLNTMQPLNRLHDLRPGQQWQIALFDPLSLIVDSLAGSKLADPLIGSIPANLRVQTMDAEVREANLVWSQDVDQSSEVIACLVIDYKREDAQARTWVRKSDGMVLQQEAHFLNQEMILKRLLDR
jgi:hypothetical protein